MVTQPGDQIARHPAQSLASQARAVCTAVPEQEGQGYQKRGPGLCGGQDGGAVSSPCLPPSLGQGCPKQVVTLKTLSIDTVEIKMSIWAGWQR